MNPEDFSRNDVVDSLGGFPAGVGLLILILLWLATVLFRSRLPSLRIPLGIFGAISATAALWFAFQLAAKWFSLATSWPLLAIAIIGGLASEAILWIYRFEKGLVTKTKGRWLLALRLGALAVLLVILVQPVRSFLEEREIDREIAILIDSSESMRLADQRLNASQKLDRAQLFQVNLEKKRISFSEIENTTRALDELIASEESALSSAPSPMAGLENRAARLPEFFTNAKDSNTTLTTLLTNAQNQGLTGDVSSKVSDYLKRSRDGVARILPLAESASTEGNAEELIKQLGVARAELSAILDTIVVTAQKSDDDFLKSLSNEDRSEVEKAAATPRIQIAEAVLTAPLATDTPDNNTETKQGIVTDLTLLNQLEDKYNLRLYEFARDVDQISSPEELGNTGEGVATSSRTQTDLTAALEHVLDNTSPESLAGILLLSDGQHNTTALPEDSLRQLAVRNTPLSSVPIGGDLGPVDISLLDLKAPESIYLDDRVVVTAEVKLDGFLGEKIEAELVSGGEVVETIAIDVTDVNFRSEIRFVHRPEDKGILDYQIRIKPDDREIFKNNNAWDFKVAVTDDRTNVLLVDGFPRWEFRYLRNLFYGRDKSVHLQSVLLDPDEIHRTRQPSGIPASATRPFGEAEATELPKSREEWQLFDVIILGDINPGALDNRDWQAIEEAVTRRGALLVCIAGQRYMPHAHNSETLQKLLPLTYTVENAAQSNFAQPGFKIELTSAGRNHPVTSQSTSRALNAERWSNFPLMHWRYADAQLKETAEVLAYARTPGSGSITSFTPDGSPGSVEAAIQQLANQENIEKENAVISVQRSGLGKVLMLQFDQTWRFRYGVGDTYHHRFWGQITRWGAGPNLRSGNETLRLGTDRLSYTPSDAIEVTAKVLDEERRPDTDADVDIEVWKDGARLRKQQLSYRTGSSGLYETSLSGLQEEGEYEIKLTGSDEEISTEVLVVTTRNPIELAELTADREFLNRTAQMTGGVVAELNNLPGLLNSFGAPKEILTERRDVTLWDKWPLLLSFLGLLTTEWIIRRRSGLV